MQVLDVEPLLFARAFKFIFKGIHLCCECFLKLVELVLHFLRDNAKLIDLEFKLPLVVEEVVNLISILRVDIVLVHRYLSHP